MDAFAESSSAAAGCSVIQLPSSSQYNAVTSYDKELKANQERLKDAMSYDDMMAYCRSNRDSDGFCRCCNGCSGPTTSNLAEDYPMPDGLTVYRGGNYGSCRFEVRE